MKKWTVLIILSLVAVFSGFAKDNQEFRAVWVITWEHSSSSDDVASSKARIIRILDNVKDANMNAVLWQIRQGGVVYYNSAYEPWGPYANGPYPGGYDPFAFAIEEAHKRGLEIHAWFNVFAASHTDPGTPAGDHPEWICRDRDGNPMQSHIALSPGLQEVRDYTLKVAMEVVRKYDIDGFHMDYIRWNEYSSSTSSQVLAKGSDRRQELDGMITPQQIENLQAVQSSRYLYDVNHPYSAGVPAGYDTWEDWWRDSVTKFVHTLHDSIQSVKPWVRLSPAALGKYRWGSWQGYGSVYQDAGLWFNQGYVDQLTPMHYHWTSGDGFYGMLAGNGDESWGYWIQPGIDAGRLYTVGPGSYVLAENNIWYRHKEIVDRCRTVPWVDGFQFFSYGDWQDYRYWKTAAQLFFQNKTKVRAAKFLLDEVPPSPALVVSKIDSLQYELTVEPPDTLSKNQRFAIYRSEDDTLDVDKDRIVNIHFGKEAYSVVDSFSGNQDFNGKYTYFATTLDRYWNESEISNSFITDSIPSFAPRVIATYPMDGDSLPVNESVVLYFSKTMNAESFHNHVKINSGAQISGLTWSDGYKTLTISFIGNLAFNTQYTLTVSDSVTDINGKGLDGNGDGGSSEPFIFTFQTLSEDKSGPKVIFSNLSPDHLTDYIDTQDVIVIGFDEQVNTDSLNSDDVEIVNSDTLVPSQFLTHTIRGATVLSLQPTEPFGSFLEYTVHLSSSILDTAGNPMDGATNFEMRTEALAYAEEKMIDEMRSGTGTWEDPDYSGSTVGTIGSGCTFGYSSSFYLPAAKKRYEKHSGELNYQWDPAASDYLLREYCSGGTAKTITFDSSYTLQCYVYGDGSGNQFRFSLKETNGSGYPLEVSKWKTIDWLGWKIVEWDLSDPNSVGTWLGDEVLNGEYYQIDSYQLTHPDGAAMKGTLYFKNLRAVKKRPHITGMKQENNITPRDFMLSQNYPNPFNPTTYIDFYLPDAGKTVFTIYNMLGQKIRVLINGYLPAGRYHIRFDGKRLASGMYVYELRNDRKVLRKRMILLK